MEKYMKIFNKIYENKGIALLFSIMLSAIFISIALGVLNITTNELNFSASSKDTNNAFFAADSGIECALYNDRIDSTYFIDPATGGGGVESDFTCFGNPINLGGNFSSGFNFTVTGLGSNSNSCAKVEVVKSYDLTDPSIILTKITSKGYNIGGNNNCDQAGLVGVERVLEVNY